MHGLWRNPSIFSPRSTIADASDDLASIYVKGDKAIKALTSGGGDIDLVSVARVRKAIYPMGILARLASPNSTTARK
jgi:hypothetical protein